MPNLPPALSSGAMPWAGLRLSITLLTAVPAGRPSTEAPTRSQARAAMYWAPAIGLAIGAIAAGVLLLATKVGHTGSLLGAVLSVTTLAALTRALHLDGLADLADGLGSRKPADQALEIMKRSDIGPFGVVTLVLVLLVQVSALARADQLGRGPVAVAAAAVGARLAIMLACRRTVKPARPGGLGALVAGTINPWLALLAVAAALAASAAFGWIYPTAIAIGLAVSVAVCALAVRRLGGITGDVLGGLAEITAAICLLVMAVR
jgi:adenosylcobinamide-GDP ribazoletransferase